MKTLPYSEGHSKFRTEILAVMRKHIDHLPEIEILAIVSQLVGQVMALQPVDGPNGMVLIETVMANIQMGNNEMVANMRKEKGPMQ